MKNLNIIIFLITISMIFGNCAQKSPGKDRQSGQALLYLINAKNSNILNSPASNECLKLVSLLNTCVASGFGFEPSTMCVSFLGTDGGKDSTGAATTLTAVDKYAATQTACGAVIQTIGCNLNQYRYPTAAVAKSSFASCDKYGLIKVYPYPASP